MATPTNTFQSLFVNANGVKTRFIVAGQGRPVVLVHGGGPGSSGEYGWWRNIPVLAQHFQVFALDRIGFGLTDTPQDELGDPVLARHLADFIDAVCLKEVYMIGNSMGAYGVARYALDFPDRVKKMVLVASGSIGAAMGLEHKPSEGMRAMRRFDSEPTRENMRAVLEGLVSNKAGITDELIEGRFKLASQPGAMRSQKLQQNYRQRLQNDPNLRQQYSMLHRLPELTIPPL
jgi:pimeloyl-ACP methyl ester carboxylesterase